MTIKITLRKDKENMHGLCPVVIQLSEDKRVVRIPLGFSVNENDFDFEKTVIKKSNTEYNRLNQFIKDAKSKIIETNRILIHIKNAGALVSDEINTFKEFYLCKTEELESKTSKFIEEHGLKVEHLFFHRHNPDDPNTPLQYQRRVKFEINIPIGMHDTVRKLIRKIITNEKDTLIDEVSNDGESNFEEHAEEITKFNETWRKYLIHCKSEKRPNTASRLDNFYNILKEYTESNVIPLTFHSLDEDFGAGFKQYLLNDHYNYLTKQRGVSNGTVHNIMKSIAAFLNWAFKKSLNDSIEFKKWRTQKPKTDLQYLTEPQLKDLRKHKLITGSSFDKSRDLWLFSAYCGMRVGDIQRWLPSYVTNDGSIKYKSEKTRKHCTVGLNKVTRAILKKYGNELPKQNSVLVNKNIKKILAEMGYDKIMVNRVIAKGTKDIVITIPLSQAITVHSAKRSFINLMISKNIQIAHLSTMIGNDVKSLMVYYKDDTSQIKKVMDGITFS